MILGVVLMLNMQNIFSIFRGGKNKKKIKLVQKQEQEKRKKK